MLLFNCFKPESFAASQFSLHNSHKMIDFVIRTALSKLIPFAGGKCICSLHVYHLARDKERSIKRSIF